MGAGQEDFTPSVLSPTFVGQQDSSLERALIIRITPSVCFANTSLMEGGEGEAARLARGKPGGDVRGSFWRVTLGGR